MSVLCCRFGAHSGDAKKRRRRVRDGKDGRKEGRAELEICSSDTSQNHVHDDIDDKTMVLTTT